MLPRWPAALPVAAGGWGCDRASPAPLDGCALAAEIKNARPRLPVVMLTDHLELPDRALASVDALVTKSDGAHFLLAAVDFVLSVKPASRHAEKLPSRTSVRPSGTSRQKTKAVGPPLLNSPLTGK